MPIQLDFILRQLVQMAHQDEGLRGRQPWKAALEKDYGWPTLRRGHPQTSYAPMAELLAYLETNGFSNYVVSGGGRLPR
jgi:hypothetical protein